MALPSFHLSEIPEEGMSVTCDVHPDELTLTSEEADVVGGLFVSLNIFLMGRRIDVNGVLSGTFRRQCVRCLRAYDDAVELPFAAEYQCDHSAKRSAALVVKELYKAPEGEEDPQEADAEEETYVCAGDRLELGEMLREQVILATPMQPLCSQDCRGLCPICGLDRNEKTCECIEERRQNPFTALRDLQKRSDADEGLSRSHLKSKSPPA